MVTFENKEEAEFWRKMYLAASKKGSASNVAAYMADAALVLHRERLVVDEPQDQAAFDAGRSTLSRRAIEALLAWVHGSGTESQAYDAGYALADYIRRSSK